MAGRWIGKSILIIATLGSILNSQLSWESGKFQLARWSHRVALLLWKTTRPPTHPQHLCGVPPCLFHLFYPFVRCPSLCIWILCVVLTPDWTYDHNFMCGVHPFYSRIMCGVPTPLRTSDQISIIWMCGVLPPNTFPSYIVRCPHPCFNICLKILCGVPNPFGKSYKIYLIWMCGVPPLHLKPFNIIVDRLAYLSS